MMPIWWTSAASFAAMPLSAAELTAAEQQAAAIVERCEQLGPACGATPEELGRAFVARATAAAVLRGDLDVQAVANASLLAPEAVEIWRDLLPTAADVQPQAWVAAWVRPAPAVAAPVAAPEGDGHASWRGTGPGVIRGAVTRNIDPSSGTTTEGKIEARGSWGPLGVLLDGRWANTIVPQAYWPGIPNRQIPSFSAREVRASLATGPRWTRTGGAELLPHVGLGLGSAGLTESGYHILYDHGLVSDPAIVSLSAYAGMLAVHPLRTGGPLAIRWTATTQYEGYWRLAKPLSPNRDVIEDREQPASPRHISAVFAPELRLQSGDLLVSAGPSFEYTLGVDSLPLRTFLGAAVGWQL